MKVNLQEEYGLFINGQWKQCLESVGQLEEDNGQGTCSDPEQGGRCDR